MKIGIIGSGAIGGILGKLWAQTGHEVLFSSRHPETLSSLVARTLDESALLDPDGVLWNSAITEAELYERLNVVR